MLRVDVSPAGGTAASLEQLRGEDSNMTIDGTGETRKGEDLEAQHFQKTSRRPQPLWFSVTAASRCAADLPESMIERMCQGA